MNVKHLSPIIHLGVLSGIPAYIAAQEAERPNIIVILADDMGYSDLGCYGGEIQTPNLDRLAYDGLRFSRFYNTSRSCPTRASLLTGLYPHQAGMGRMNDTHGTTPVYKGELSRNAVTIAEVLKTAGYQTGMVGKWHLSESQPNKPDQKLWVAHQVYYPEFVPKHTLPTHRGFDDFYGMSAGAADYFDPFSLLYGDEPVREVPEDYYFTQALSDSAVAFVNRYCQQEEPFFLYMAYNAPHWPLHAQPEDIKKYEDVYKVGWDTIRNRRYRRMLDLKIFGDRTDYLTPRNPTKAWSTNKDREWDAMNMAVYAAMIDRLDQGVGQVIDALEQNGELENTLILFMSDNGCANELAHTFGAGGIRPSMTRDGAPIIYPANKEVMPGPETTYAGLLGSWTNTSNAPFRLWKKKSAEGGICTPMIAYWPQGMKAKNKGKVTEAMGHVMDIMATCVDVAGAAYPEVYNGNIIVPLEGKSLVPVFETGDRDGHEEIGFEHFKEKALITKDLWKIVQSAEDNKPWELYNLDTDRTERKNLAKTYPDKVKELTTRYEAWAKRCLVKPGIGYPADKTPVAISDVSDLDFIRNNLKGNFYLTNDIELLDGAEWVPLGAVNADDGNPTAFEGTLDGRGYTIGNINIEKQGAFKGLFARLQHATVKDLKLEVDITGGDVVGGLCGAMYGQSTIQRVCVSGSVRGNNEVGGIAGRVSHSTSYAGYNKIQDCYVEADVEALNDKAGGIVGYARKGETNAFGKIELDNVYVSGKVSVPKGNASGLLAYVDHKYLKMSDAVVLCRDINGATPNYFYSRDIEPSQIELLKNIYVKESISLTYQRDDDKGQGAGINTDGRVMEEAVLHTKDFYRNTLGWDFDKVWSMVENEYPVLQIPAEDSNSLNVVPASEIGCDVYVSKHAIVIDPQGQSLAVNIFNVQGQLMHAVKEISAQSVYPVKSGTYVINLQQENKVSAVKVVIQ